MDTTADSAYGQMAAFRDEQNGLAHVRGILDMPSEARSILIKELLSSMPEHEIVDVYNHIRVLLRHDFVDALPAELYSRIFTLLDDRTLARCELVRISLMLDALSTAGLTCCNTFRCAGHGAMPFAKAEIFGLSCSR
eukprot:TRINITY_DN6317_c0_g1_i3.p2 TRINITY_DN6317_c0_g1~~TRINITY_DN6317_c0_g1_i3.p2  ORF type:complete len:137 (+),score=9.18 TRINITY_DN6317_c0_g1_i3:166-576(+)